MHRLWERASGVGAVLTVLTVLAAGALGAPGCSGVLGLDGLYVSCQPAETRCADDAVQTCQDGLWSDTMPCGAGEHCQSGACVVSCTSGDVRCLVNTPQVCVAGQWRDDAPCSESTCSLGVCQGVCAMSAGRCAGDAPERCSATGQWEAQPACAAGQTCSGGACGGGSCLGLPATCGPHADEDCCASLEVTGGTYNRSNDAKAPATVSSFRLDRFEITVGRLRLFVSAVMGGFRPAAGSGKHAHLHGGLGLNDGTEPGWDPAWNSQLAATKAGWDQNLGNGGDIATWTLSAGANETTPIDNLSWWEAYAFCIWDGGFLPSEAEWNYAAAGGADQRPYPWGDKLTHADAVYDLSPPSLAPVQVGSKSPQGDGAWGQADLAGNVREWTLDQYEDAYPTPCVDCVDLTLTPKRALRGGCSDCDGESLLSSFRDGKPSDERANLGARCARAL